MDKYWFKTLASGILISFIYTLMVSECRGQQSPTSSPSYSDVVMQNGDAIRFAVWEGWHSPSDKSILSSFNNEYVIDGNGNIRLPIIGLFKVAGKKASTIETEMQEQLAPYAKSPTVSCIPLIKVSLMGAFNRPGTYRIKADATFWELVEKAYGPDSEADLSKSHVKREGKVIIKNLIRSFERGQSIIEMGIQSGDQIYFAERAQITFEKVVRYVNFGISLLMLGFTIENYRSKN